MNTLCKYKCVKTCVARVVSAGRAPPFTGEGKDRGAVTIEAALGICAVLTVFSVLLGGIGMFLVQLRCTDAAIEAAREAARGDRESARAAVSRLAPDGSGLGLTVHGDLVEAEVRAAVPSGMLQEWASAQATAALEPSVGVADVEGHSTDLDGG